MISDLSRMGLPQAAENTDTPDHSVQYDSSSQTGSSLENPYERNSQNQCNSFNRNGDEANNETIIKQMINDYFQNTLSLNNYSKSHCKAFAQHLEKILDTAAASLAEATDGRPAQARTPTGTPPSDISNSGRKQSPLGESDGSRAAVHHENPEQRTLNFGTNRSFLSPDRTPEDKQLTETWLQHRLSQQQEEAEAKRARAAEAEQARAAKTLLISTKRDITKWIEAATNLIINSKTTLIVTQASDEVRKAFAIVKKIQQAVKSAYKKIEEAGRIEQHQADLTELKNSYSNILTVVKNTHKAQLTSRVHREKQQSRTEIKTQKKLLESHRRSLKKILNAVDHKPKLATLAKEPLEIRLELAKNLQHIINQPYPPKHPITKIKLDTDAKLLVLQAKMALLMVTTAHNYASDTAASSSRKSSIFERTTTPEQSQRTAQQSPPPWK